MFCLHLLLIWSSTLINSISKKLQHNTQRVCTVADARKYVSHLEKPSKHPQAKVEEVLCTHYFHELLDPEYVASLS
jgi:hypothetical protein